MANTLQLLNQVFELEQKIAAHALSSPFERNFSRLYHLFEEENLICINPTGEKYLPSRTDCEANIVGAEHKNMSITKVLKPAVYQKEAGQLRLLQKAVVIVE